MPELIPCHSTVKKILSFSELTSGWDFGHGQPINKNVITRAIFINSIGQFYHFNSTALPDSDGSIIINLFKEDTFLLITIKENLTLDLVYEKGIGTNYEIIRDKENVSIQDIEDSLQEMNRQWFSLGIYTSINTILPGNDSEVTASKIQVEFQEFQYLSKNAQQKKADQYVIISKPFIDQQFHTPSFSLELT